MKRPLCGRAPGHCTLRAVADPPVWQTGTKRMAEILPQWQGGTAKMAGAPRFRPGWRRGGQETNISP